MKTQNLLIIISIAILSTSAVYAQKVEVALFDGHPVINCEGMPPAAYTTTSKGNTKAMICTSAANATLYKRFAIHKSDNSTSSTWGDAFYNCFDIGTGWRLPTQRELMLIWVLKREVEQTEGFGKFVGGNYWSASESTSSTMAWRVDFLTGTTREYIAVDQYSIRCIRELP